jgi:excisionase family DNA binding protein
MKDEALYLRHIMECMRRIEANVAGGREPWMASYTLQDAVLRNLQTMNYACMKSLDLPTAQEVAALLRVDEATVRRWLRDGELAGLRVGRAWRTSESALQVFLEERSREEEQPLRWFVARPEDLEALTGIGSCAEPGDARTDLESYWDRAFS